MSHESASFGRRALCLAGLSTLLLPSIAAAQAPPVLRLYGPGGPAPAMREAAAAFERAGGLRVELTAGPTGAWLDKARTDADLVFSGSEAMMTDLVNALSPALDHRQVTPLYLRPLAMLVRPGNPRRIRAFEDLQRPGLSLLVVNGAGQTGAWEDAAGRQGDMAMVRAVRRNIAAFARNSGEAQALWQRDTTLDVWLIWNTWQLDSPALADLVPIEPAHAVFRGASIALTTQGRGRPAAQAFVDFLQSPAGAGIFARRGWMAG